MLTSLLFVADPNNGIRLLADQFDEMSRLVDVAQEGGQLNWTGIQFAILLNYSNSLVWDIGVDETTWGCTGALCAKWRRGLDGSLCERSKNSAVIPEY